MPDVTISQAMKEAYAAAPVSAIVYHTLEIWHPSFADPIRVVMDNADLTATLEDDAARNPGESVLFVRMAFSVQLPEVETSAPGQCVIEIDNVDRMIVSALEQAVLTTDAIEITWRAFLSSDLSAPQHGPQTLTVKQVTADVFRVRAVCGYGDVSNARFPTIEYTAERFPGLIPS